MLIVLSLLMWQSLWAQREKTSFQTLTEWKPTIDVRSDVVMVYGAGDYTTLSFHDRVNSWRDHGYATHFMSGIAWGGFDAYFKGEWDGKPHNDEVQKRLSGEGIMHGPNSPYVVPTHSLLNYAQWGIVSPECSLHSLENCDGYIAQVWTGTSRMANHYNGVLKERVFEMAFLEYGCLESMARPTGRKMYFLTDPIEDRAVNWEDYKL